MANHHIIFKIVNHRDRRAVCVCVCVCVCETSLGHISLPYIYLYDSNPSPCRCNTSQMHCHSNCKIGVEKTMSRFARTLRDDLSAVEQNNSFRVYHSYLSGTAVPCKQISFLFTTLCQK